MSRNTVPEYDKRRISDAFKAYRTDITVNDPVDVSTRLAIPVVPTDDKQQIMVSLIFDTSGDTANLVIVYLSKDPNTGELFAAGVSEPRTVTPGEMVDTNADEFAAVEVFDSASAPFYEVRVRALTGTIQIMRTWPY